jgi:lipopolysaccharide export system protein LptA
MTRLVVLGLLALLSAPRPAAAQGIDLSSGGPVTVTARGGFEWRENEQVVIATDDARAVRGDVTVLADRLTAHYRKKRTGPGEIPAAPPPTQANGAAGEPDSGGNEVYRLEADGHVRILTPTDEAVGDHAVYDIDQAVLVMTGQHMKLTTPQQVMTARDSMEYWSQKHMAVGRGDAVVVTSDGRRIAADVLVGFTDPNPPPGQTSPGQTLPGQTSAAQPVAATQGGKPPSDPLMASGKLRRVEGYGNVEVRTQMDTVRGDRGVYVPDTGIARIVGHVRVTRGENQLNGPAADVNMKTGVAHIISDPGQRVQGLLMPNSTDKDAAPTGAAQTGPARPGSAPAAMKSPQPQKAATP